MLLEYMHQKMTNLETSPLDTNTSSKMLQRVRNYQKATMSSQKKSGVLLLISGPLKNISCMHLKKKMESLSNLVSVSTLLSIFSINQELKHKYIDQKIANKTMMT